MWVQPQWNSPGGLEGSEGKLLKQGVTFQKSAVWSHAVSNPQSWLLFCFLLNNCVFQGTVLDAVMNIKLSENWGFGGEKHCEICKRVLRCGFQEKTAAELRQEGLLRLRQACCRRERAVTSPWIKCAGGDRLESTPHWSRAHPVRSLFQ